MFFLDLSLDIPAQTSAIGRPSRRRKGPPPSCLLEDAIQSFLQKEDLNGYKCSGCSSTTSCSKQYFIHSLPNVCISIIRYFFILIFYI